MHRSKHDGYLAKYAATGEKFVIGQVNHPVTGIRMVCVYTCIYTYTYIHIHIYTYIYIYIYIYIYTYTCACVCVYVRERERKKKERDARAHLLLHVNLLAQTFALTHTRTNTYI